MIKKIYIILILIILSENNVNAENYFRDCKIVTRTKEINKNFEIFLNKKKIAVVLQNGNVREYPIKSYNESIIETEIFPRHGNNPEVGFKYYFDAQKKIFSSKVYKIEGNNYLDMPDQPIRSYECKNVKYNFKDNKNIKEDDETYVETKEKLKQKGEEIKQAQEALIPSKAMNLYNRVKFCWAKYGLYELDGLVQTIDVHKSRNNYYRIIDLSETFFKHPIVINNIRDKNCQLD